MELIRINDKKLKIMLSSLDMKNYALDSSGMSCETEETRKAFRSILHDAGVRGGFDTSSEKIFIQMYPSREGGCEMFVTRLDLGIRAGAAQSEHAQPKEEADTMQQSDSTSPLAFSFSCLSHLLRACAVLRQHQREKSPPHSIAYRDERDTYYLTVQVQNDSRGAGYCAMLEEFGSRCDEYCPAAYLCEHARVLCARHAIATLGALA